MSQPKRTVGLLATEIAHNCRTITDTNTRKIMETVYMALELAHKEIEELKLQLSQQPQTKAD